MDALQIIITIVILYFVVLVFRTNSELSWKYKTKSKPTEPEA
jgi:hypothetical protein